MAAYFVDSSALVKRYVSEAGTAWLQSILDPQTHNPTIIARATWVEVLSAFARRQREGTLLPNQVVQAARFFRYDLDTQYQVVKLASALRILPVFARISSTSLVFLSADDRLLSAASAEGLAAENPDHHA